MKLTYKLYQQTPMIHFQAKEGRCEEGLTLRPSEVKPKLDRFIRQWYKKNNSNKLVPVEWLTEYDKDGKRPEHEALNYKMRIIAGKPEVSSIKNNSSYFGNMGMKPGTPDYRYQVFDKGKITVEIICFIKELEELIEATIETFFLITNFGTRQDKGFGCFVVQKNEKNENNPNRVDELLKTWYDNRPIIKLDYTNCNNQNIDYLAEINWIYKLLKSGVNMKGDYVKSALTEYFLKDGIAGEKRALKRSGVGPAVYHKKNGQNEFYAVIEENNQKEIPKENERYIRGLFGYGEQQEWFSADSQHSKVEDGDKKDKNGNPKYKKTTINIKPAKRNEIERIPSPLQFVVVNSTIYIIPIGIDERVCVKNEEAKEYEFYSIYNPEYKRDKEKCILKIPAQDEFNLNDFMIWFEKWLKNENNERERLSNNNPFFERESKGKRIVSICRVK